MEFCRCASFKILQVTFAIGTFSPVFIFFSVNVCNFFTRLKYSGFLFHGQGHPLPLVYACHLDHSPIFEDHHGTLHIQRGVVEF
jgi:hypothetical protein